MSKKSRRWNHKAVAQRAQEQSARDKARNQGKNPDGPVAKSDTWITVPSNLYQTMTLNGMSFGFGEPAKPQPRPELPSRQQVDTIRAFKLAKMVADGGKIRLQGVGSNVIYDIDATAECHAGFGNLFASFASAFGEDKAKKHDPPEAHCSCGFYGVPHKHAKEVQTDYATSRFVRVEAELFGRVVKHERGYRAERQRVVSVAVPRKCRTLGPARSGSWFIMGSAEPEIDCSNPPIGMRQDGGYVVPSCQEHAPLGVVPLPDIARLLGAQVRWA